MQNKHVAYTYQELLDEGGLYLSSTNLEQRKKKECERGVVASKMWSVQ